jgi:hypothetical protein
MMHSGARQICLPETHLYYPESYLRQSTMSCRKSTKRQSKHFLEVFVRERGSLTARNRPPQARNATPTQSALLRFCPTCTSPRLGQHRRWVPHASWLEYTLYAEERASARTLAEDFGHIPTYLLPSITLTCRSFRSLAQPLLFTTIATHPERSTSSAKDRRRVVDRLDFLFSPRSHQR